MKRSRSHAHPTLGEVWKDVIAMWALRWSLQLLFSLGLGIGVALWVLWVAQWVSCR